MAGLKSRPFKEAAYLEVRRGGLSAVAEVTYSSEDHGKIEPVGGFDHLVIAHGPSGLDDGGRTGLGDYLQAIGEGKEGV